MAETLTTRKASIHREWRPLTGEHGRQLDRVDKSFSKFTAGEEIDPLALVGAYRSGKTQLIYHRFNDAWERGIPAFYIGDPGEMLNQYIESEETNLNAWIQSRIDEQLAAYTENDPSGIEWFPNTDAETKKRFVDEHGDDLDLDQTIRTALFFDEVEQSYRDFIRVMDKDDSNPLRKINDGLQDSIKIWSFGMISAFEFIGEADWGRMREIRIPPLEVDDVRNLLEDQRPDATELANVIWWLARGRTGLIIKLIDGLPNDIEEEEAVDWLRELADANFRDTRPINNIWTDLERGDWEPAIKAILFLEDGFDTWQVEQDAALTVPQCQILAINIIKEEFSFDETEDAQDALEILDRNVERVFSGLAVTDESLFPTFGLSEQEQAAAFVSLVSDMTVSFEPASTARSIATEALDALEDVFHTNWIERASKADTIEQHVATAAPKIVQEAFPPIAVNPERVSERSGDDLQDAMKQGLSIEPDTGGKSRVNISFCPTVESLNSELSELVNSYDITKPKVLVVPDDEGFDISLGNEVDVYTRHQLLKIESYQSNRFWTFITNLYGRLDEESLSGPYFVNENKKTELLNRCEEREVRNTIETLYDQLQQVAVDYVEVFEQNYRGTYSLGEGNTLIWEEERLNGQKPYWSNGEFIESTVALSYLPLFGPEYEPVRDYSKLYKHLKYAIVNDLVAGNKGGFQFKTYFDDLFTQSGYSDRVDTERNHYEVDGQLAPAVKQTRDTLTALAKLNDASEIISKLDDPAVDLKTDQVPVASVSGLTHLGYGLIRALLISGLTIGDGPEIDIKARLRNIVSEIETEISTIEDYKEQVDSRNNQLTSPDAANVGTWIDIKASQLDDYETNLEKVQDRVEDLIKKVEADSSAGPIGYHYWFLTNIYIDDISEQIDDLESQISAANVDEITDAVRLFESVHAIIAEEEFVEFVFDSREDLLDRVEQYGNRIFDLESHLGYTELSIPEDNDDLDKLNRTVGKHTQHLSSLEQDLRSIRSNSEQLEQELEESREALLNLLTEKETMVTTDD